MTANRSETPKWMISAASQNTEEENEETMRTKDTEAQQRDDIVHVWVFNARESCTRTDGADGRRE